MIRAALSNRDHRRYLAGEIVRSLLHRLGRVIGPGHNPTVQFLVGSRHRVEGKTLTSIPDEEFDAEFFVGD